MTVLEWLKQRCHAMDAEACICAALSGRLSVLQWLRSQDPPCAWNARVVQTAKACGYAHIADWAISNGCPSN
jgi:hypothetical protein